VPTTELTQTGDAEVRALDALLEIVKTANSPDVLEAQAILLRRLALQGDVIASRIPAPRNITEIGGYLNLLETLHQPEARAQMLAGILGVAGPNPPPGWMTGKPPLSLVPLANDRPDGPAQPTIPLTFAVRSDFAAGVEAARAALHAQDAMLPLLAPVRPLPPPVAGVDPPTDPLPWLGRTIQIVPSTALVDVANDPIAVARKTGTTDPFEIVSRSTSAAQKNWDAIECTTTACAPKAVANARFVPVAPILAPAGFYPVTPLPQPANVTATAWSRFTNVTGLVAGVSTLGDELSLLYTAADVLGSAFASRLGWTWTGSAFAQP
jgi:hypothetical protein